MAYQSGLISDTMTRLNRRRSLTGRSLTLEEMRGFYEPMLAYEAQKDIAAGEREQNQRNIDRQLSLQEKAQKDAARAATVSGIADIGMGAGNLYFANKYLGLLKGGHAGLTTPAPSAPSAFGGAAGGGSGLMGGAAGGGSAMSVPMAGAPAYSSAPLTYGAAGEMGAGVAPSTAAPGVGLLGAAGTAAGLFGLQQLSAPYVNELVGDKLNMPYAAKGWQYGGLPGAMIGGSVDVVSKGIDLAKNLFDDLF